MKLQQLVKTLEINLDVMENEIKLEGLFVLKWLESLVKDLADPSEVSWLSMQAYNVQPKRSKKSIRLVCGVCGEMLLLPASEEPRCPVCHGGAFVEPDLH